MKKKGTVRVQATIPLVVDSILEHKMGSLGSTKSERVKNILMIYLAERGYLTSICEEIK
ncbi:MAG: hypothetical protein WBA22_06320 [Candidatus Methanofastidiosia archaeon]